MNRRSVAIAFLLAAVALLPGLSAAQSYPVKTVKIVAPAQPGGGMDLVGRTIAEQLSRSMAQSFIVENVSGGGGTIGSHAVARAAPDGYTLMVGNVSSHGTNPAVRKVPYDAVRDFTPIAMVGGTPNVLVVHPSVPANTSTWGPLTRIPRSCEMKQPSCTDERAASTGKPSNSGM